MPTETATVYRLAPAVAARLLGVVLCTVAVLILISTVLIAAVDLHTVFLLVPAGLALVLLVATWWTWRQKGWVVRLTPEGYRVQWVRGVGAPSARWKDVEDAVRSDECHDPGHAHEGRQCSRPALRLVGQPCGEHGQHRPSECTAEQHLPGGEVLIDRGSRDERQHDGSRAAHGDGQADDPSEPGPPGAWRRDGRSAAATDRCFCARGHWITLRVDVCAPSATVRSSAGSETWPDQKSCQCHAGHVHRPAGSRNTFT